jgi:hypothetical protein
VDLLTVLRLETTEDAAGLAAPHGLYCTVGAGSPLGVFSAGARVILHSLGGGTFRVVPDAPGLTACCVGETVHVLEFLSPRRGLEALGLEASDEPIRDGAHRDTRVVDPARCAANGIACDGVGSLATVYGRGHGHWSVSTFGRDPASADIDAWAFYTYRTPAGDALERASVHLDLATLVEGGRLLARVAEPERLAARGIRNLAAGDLVLLARGAGGAWTLSTLLPGFSCGLALDVLDLDALGLESPRLLDLPAGGRVAGRIRFAWKAAREGLKGARSRDPVEVAREADGAYRLRDLAPHRPVSLLLPTS